MRSRRREMDLGIGLFTHEREAEALERSYTEAVGWALQYGIKTYLPGTGRPGDWGPWGKALGTLREEIRQHEESLHWQVKAAERSYAERHATEVNYLHTHKMQDLFIQIERNRMEMERLEEQVRQAEADVWAESKPWWKRLLRPA